SSQKKLSQSISALFKNPFLWCLFLHKLFLHCSIFKVHPRSLFQGGSLINIAQRDCHVKLFLSFLIDKKCLSDMVDPPEFCSGKS
ncbi:MAG: hypothetical protein IJH48_08280, partial [Oscillospiraceae bacterium]|nr:hypothetical protein [Oscillospiraceae bacterium]